VIAFKVCILVRAVEPSNLIRKQKGDRVAAFHEMQAPGGSFAEYAIAWEHSTFHIPPSKSYEGKQLTEPNLQS